MEAYKLSKEEGSYDGEAAMAVSSAEFEQFELDKDLLDDGGESASVLVLAVKKVKKAIDRAKSNRKRGERDTYKLSALADLIIYEAMISGASIKDSIRWAYHEPTIEELLESLLGEVVEFVSGGGRVADLIIKKREEALNTL